MKSQTFCSLPFTHLNIKQKGKISACWRYPGKIGEYDKQSLSDVWNGKEIKDIRRALLNNERYEGCKSCWDMEDAGIKSTRQQHEPNPMRTEEDVRNIIDKDFNMPIEELKHIEIRFDNICNLMCRHCSSDYSSKWHAAVQSNDELKEKMLEHGTYRDIDSVRTLNDETIVEIGRLSSNIKTILISGGEPLFHDKHYKFLEAIEDNAHEIELSYNTNLTTLSHKGKNILDLWKKFRIIRLRVSIDADPSIYTYVRTGTHLPDIEKHIQIINDTMPNSRLSTTCTTSILNITRLPSIFEYFNSIGGYIHTSIVQYPQALNPRIIPQTLKDNITECYNTWMDDIENKLSKTRHENIDLDRQILAAKRYGDSVIKYMNSKDQSDNWNKFIDYAKILDKYHGSNILKLYPEFLPYWR